VAELLTTRVQAGAEERPALQAGLVDVSPDRLGGTAVEPDGAPPVALLEETDRAALEKPPSAHGLSAGFPAIFASFSSFRQASALSFLPVAS
jgi:hypothetical protein